MLRRQNLAKRTQRTTSDRVPILIVDLVHPQLERSLQSDIIEIIVLLLVLLVVFLLQLLVLLLVDVSHLGLARCGEVLQNCRRADG